MGLEYEGLKGYPGQHLEGIIEGCAGDVGGRPSIYNVIPPARSQLLQAQHIAALMHGADVICRGLPEVCHVHQLHAPVLCVSTGKICSSDSCSTISQYLPMNAMGIAILKLCHLSGQGLGCEFISLQGIQYSSPPGCAFWVTQAIMTGRWSADIEELWPLCICAQGLQGSGCYLHDAVSLLYC